MRKIALKEGGAIGFIEEIDAIGLKRGALGYSAVPGPASALGINEMINQGTGGVVNELLVQMQSFDEPTRTEKA